MNYVAFAAFITILMCWDLIIDKIQRKYPLQAPEKLLEHRIKHSRLHASDYPDTPLYRLLRRFSLPEK